jgi:hypothetical protein
MQALEFWKSVTVDHANLLELLISLLNQHRIKYCVIGGQGVNAYVEPVVSLDLDLAIAVEQMSEIERLLSEHFTVKRFPHSLNASVADSQLRIQIQTDPRYSEFVDAAEVHDVLGVQLPVAQVEDVLKGKIWAAMDPERRASKRQKDLADISRLLEKYPRLREQVPAEILNRLL